LRYKNPQIIVREASVFVQLNTEENSQLKDCHAAAVHFGSVGSTSSPRARRTCKPRFETCERKTFVFFDSLVAIPGPNLFELSFAPLAML
jgi:hypothetical protein